MDMLRRLISCRIIIIIISRRRHFVLSISVDPSVRLWHSPVTWLVNMMFWKWMNWF